MVLVELIKKYCDRAAVSFAKEGIKDRVAIVNLPMEEFEPNEPFDIFWFQWCIGHLTDDEFIVLLNRLKQQLAPNGLIVIKDNFASTEKTGNLLRLRFLKLFFYFLERFSMFQNFNNFKFLILVFSNSSCFPKSLMQMIRA